MRALIALFAFAAFGQTQSEPILERVLRSTNATGRDLQEMATMIRAVGQIRDVSLDEAQKAVTVRGTAAQVAHAEWMFQEVDKPANPQSLHEYRAPDGSDDVTRVFFLANAATPQELQELVTAVRSVGDIQYLYVCTKQKAVVLRANAARIARVAWLIPELDQPAEGARPATGSREFRAPFNTEVGGPHELRVPGFDDDVTRVFFLEHGFNPADLQEMAVLVRSIADIPRLFIYDTPRALPMRATAGKIATAEWLIRELDQPVGRQDAAVHEFLMPGVADNVVRVFYLTRAGSPQDLLEAATMIRVQAGIKRIFIYDTTKALAVRGTAEQIAMAAKLIDEREKTAR